MSVSSDEQPAPAPRYDVRRIVPSLQVGLGVAGLLVICHLALRAMLGPDPAWLRDDAPLDWRFYEVFGQRVAGAQWEREHRPREFPEHFGVMIGASTIAYGPLPDVVEKGTGYPWLLLGVGGGPTAITKIHRSLHVLEDAGLRPDILVFGLHAMWLPTPEPRQEDTSSAFSELWFLRHQKAASNYLYTAMQLARERLAYAVGYGAWMAFTPANDPWHPAPTRPIEQPESEAQVRWRRERDAAAGRYDASRYQADSKPMQDLASIIRELQASSESMVVALFPEHSAHRELMPENASRYLLDAVRGSSASPPAILDLRDAIPDADFIDTYHLTMTGRRALSERLGSELPPRPNGPDKR